MNAILPTGKKSNISQIMLFIDRTLWWWLLALVLILTLGWYFIFARPVLTTGHVLQSFVEKNKYESLTAAREQQQKINQVLAEYENFTSQDLLAINQLLPTDKEIPHLIMQFDAMTKESGLNITSLSFSYPDQGKTEDHGIQELLLTVNLDGSDYESLKYLVRLIEKNLRLFDIVSLQYATSGNGFTLTIKTYYFAP